MGHPGEAVKVFGEHMVWWRPREMQSYKRTCPDKEPTVDHRDGTRVRATSLLH